MSARLAAGWARSRFQSVSVVPTIQCMFHGMTNSTDFSVRRIRPLSELMRSRGTTMWTPLEARTWNWPRPPASCWTSSVHTPVQLTTTLARTAAVRPVSTSQTVAPTTRSPSRWRDSTRAEVSRRAPYDAAVRATMRVWRASSALAS